MGRGLFGKHVADVLPLPGSLLVGLFAAGASGNFGKAECPHKHFALFARWDRACACRLLFHVQIRHVARR